MRNLRCWLVALCFWPLLGAVLGACTEDSARKAGDKAALDRAGLCKEGGAVLRSSSNECICPEGAWWNGVRCELTKPKEAAPEALVPMEKDDDEDEKAAPATAAGSELEKACSEAHGEWSAEQRFCSCPEAKVLVGSTCMKLPGHLIDDACLRAVHPGKWQGGSCNCPADLIFNPFRGGCVQPVLAGDETLKYTCESSLNNGKWEASNVRCLCPKGRVWVDELCQVQQLLASQDICEAAFNKGKWDLEQKRCRCPGATIWINQACQDPKSLQVKQVCESEWNGGTWNPQRHTCGCPGRKHWNVAAWLCR